MLLCVVGQVSQVSDVPIHCHDYLPLSTGEKVS